jgi:small subunit ribosomal protein S8e
MQWAYFFIFLPTCSIVCVLLGISRDSRHKRRLTGGRRNVHIKKRKYEMGRPAASTKIGTKRVQPVRCRGGNMKYRALRLDSGNFAWGSECCTRKTRILNVVFNATSNEMIRTKTLVKNAIVEVDASLFKQWYEGRYGVVLGKAVAGEDDKKTSKKSQKRVAARQKTRVLDEHVASQFTRGRLLACITSRPGQSGRADGYILEGDELQFYQKKLLLKKK